MNEHDKKSEKRTRWAEDRTVMANERTFASWSGTGMGAIGLAVGFQAVFGSFEPTWLARAVATIPLIAALFFFVGAWRKACGTHARLTEHEVEGAKTGMFHVVTALLILTALGTAVVLWTV